jgi:protein gp37
MNKRDAGYLADCIDYRGKWSAPGRENRLWPLPNVWIGATVEHRDQLGRIGALRGVPAAGRFLSCEPLLCDLGLTSKVLEGIDWVIAGGESGPGARPMHPDWVRAARDACQAAGVPFFFKSWGRWVPAISDGQPHWFRFDPSCSNLDGCGDAEPWGDGTASIRINSKKLAGRLLDGRTWDEVPWEVHDAR